MKQVAPVLTVLALLVGVFSCGSSNNNETSEKQQKIIEKKIIKKELTAEELEETDAKTTANISIDGMACEKSCAGKIQKTLSEKAGVTSCEVNFEDKVAIIEYDDQQISDEEIISTIEDLNKGQYQVTKVEITKMIVETSVEEEVEETTTNG